ncbi:MAG: hypothetical protein U0X92_03060 [Anaerolineales bacterium]
MASKKELENNNDLENILNKLEEIERKLNVLEKQNLDSQMLLRVLAEPILSSSLQEIFKSPKDLYAYELSNGERSTREIGNLVKLDQKGISNRWRDWEKDSLVVKAGKKGQFKARYTLLELLLVYLPTRKPKST